MAYRTVWNPDPRSVSFRPGLRSGAAAAVVALGMAGLTVLAQSLFELPLRSLLEPRVQRMIAASSASDILVFVLLLVGPPLLTLAAIGAAVERLWACETLAIEPALDVLKSTRRLLLRRPEPRVFSFRDAIDVGVEVRPRGWSRVALVREDGSRITVADIPESAELVAQHVAPLRGRLRESLEARGG